MKEPRVIFETDMYNDCGLIAAAAWKYLTSHGVKARILNIRYGPADGHTIVVFESSGRISTYDHDGCLVFDENTTWDTPPILLARAWVRANEVGKKVTGGKWL
jgi:hypothetical protein